jgi:hypothetical protein
MAAVHTAALPGALRLLGLPHGKIRATLDALKTAGSITKGHHGGYDSPPITPRDITRIVLGLSAVRHADAATTSSALGDLPLFAGDGPPTAESALVAMVEAAAFLRPADRDLSFGEIVIGQLRPEIRIVHRSHDGVPGITQYRAELMPSARDEARTYFHIPMPLLRDIARRLLIS